MKKTNMEKYELLKILGKNIQTIRIAKEISIQNVSEKTKIREQYLEQIEKGTAIGMSITHLFRIAFALNVNPRDLVRGL